MYLYEKPKTKLMEANYRSRDMLLDICTSRSRVTELLSRGKDYNALLSHIVNRDIFWSGKNNLPTAAQIIEVSGVTSYWFRKYLKEIYFDLVVDDENPVTECVSSTQFYIHLTGRGKSSVMKVMGIRHIPQRGDMMDISGFKAHLGTTFFYVTEVSHEFQGGRHIVRIWLKDGFYNSYWELRKDRAKMLNELTYKDFSERSEFDIKLELSQFDKRW